MTSKCCHILPGAACGLTKIYLLCTCSNTKCLYYFDPTPNYKVTRLLVNSDNIWYVNCNLYVPEISNWVNDAPEGPCSTRCLR